MDIKKVRIRDAIEEDFDVAERYNEDTRDKLTEKEQRYADGLRKNGNEIRFNNLKIFNRFEGSNNIAGILRNTLDFKPNTDSH